MNLYILCSLITLLASLHGFKTNELSPRTRTGSLFEKLLPKNTKENEVILRRSYDADEQTSGKDFELNQHLRKLLPYNGRIGTQRFYTHAEINQYLDDLGKRYPERVSVKTEGKSTEGRLLKTITITNGDGRKNKNVILMDGGFHAREWISPAAAVHVIKQLVENFEQNEELLLNYDWVILPVVNADGYEYTQVSPKARKWRKTRRPNSNNACVGTDPNRNFDFHWMGSGTSSYPCSDVFAGPKPFSEPETVVVRDLMHNLVGRGKMYLTIHSAAKTITYPWGYGAGVEAENINDLHEVALAGQEAIYKATGSFYNIGSSDNLLGSAAGASDDYAFAIGFPIVYTFEMDGSGWGGFEPPPSSIDKLVTQAWVGIRAMAKKVIQKYPLKP